MSVTGAKTTANVTVLLQRLRAGDKEAESQLLTLVYDELRAMASRFMRRERKGHTLQTTALVNEAYLRLVQKKTDWKDRAHFFGVASQVMRHILVDYARSRLSGKRGRGVRAMPIDEALVVSEDHLEELLVLEEALHKLEGHDPRTAQVVVLHFYGGLSLEEIAEVLQVAIRTVMRDWTYGRAWLRAELTSEPRHHAPQPPESS